MYLVVVCMYHQPPHAHMWSKPATYVCVPLHILPYTDHDLQSQYTHNITGTAAQPKSKEMALLSSSTTTTLLSLLLLTLSPTTNSYRMPTQMQLWGSKTTAKKAATPAPPNNEPRPFFVRPDKFLDVATAGAVALFRGGSGAFVQVCVCVCGCVCVHVNKY